MLHPRRRYRWRGPQPVRCEEQIANAPDDLFALEPVSEAAAVTTRSNWAAVLPSSIPFIWERSYGRGREEDDPELED
jgi:hypothetical protein